ncbi:RHS repeat-associated core domain-containing protein, partial [Streptomyces omiyaensis]
PGTKGFVGGDIDTTTGLTHIGAREYDTELGQFISADPILSLEMPQSVNGYGYASNTPLTLTDPTGLMEICGASGAACYPDDWNTDGTKNTDGDRKTNDDKPKPKPATTGGGGGGDKKGTNKGGGGNYKLKCNRFGCEREATDQPKGDDRDYLAGIIAGAVDTLTFACQGFKLFGEVECAGDAVRKEAAEEYDVEVDTQAFDLGVGHGGLVAGAVPPMRAGSMLGAGARFDFFPEIAGSRTAVVFPSMVVRGDNRVPSVVFATGFSTRGGSNRDLLTYGKYNTSSSWVGTSTRRSIGAMFPQKAKGSTWVYEIPHPGAGISMNKALGWSYVFRAEKEVVFPGGIDGSAIAGARYYSWGMPTDNYVANPNYKGTP